jgi:hypothetical protein
MATLGCPVGYMNITEESMAVLECPVGYMNVMEESMAMLECPVVYVDIMEGSRNKLEWPGGYIDMSEESMASRTLQLGPGALLTFMYPTGHPSTDMMISALRISLPSALVQCTFSMTFMYPTGHSSLDWSPPW